MDEESQLIAKQIPEFLHVLEVTLRSGYSVGQSFEIANRDMSGPISTEVHRVLRDVENGASWVSALDEWFGRFPSLELDLFVATMQEQMEAGGNLANKLQFVAQVLPKLKRVGW